MNTSFRLFILATFVILNSIFAHAQVYSELWGQEGEVWSSESRLPDFSFAGYHFGEQPIPDVAPAANIIDFGAVGDGETDCTDALIKAIDSVDSGTILIPEGRFVISDIIWITKPNIVIRGAGPQKTTLFITKALEDVRPNIGKTTSGRPTSNYSWSGGFIWAKGSIQRNLLTPVISEYKRGTKKLSVESVEGLEVGQRIYLQVSDTSEKSLLKHLYSGDSGDTGKILNTISTGLVSRIHAIDGNEVTLERPLRFDVRQEWQPVLKTYTPSVFEIGIENLAIDFPVTPYRGHFTERGKNAIAMNGIADSWVRNVRISNCDSGIFLSGDFCTLDGLTIDTTREAFKGTTGHHGVTMGRDCLATNFEFKTHFIHDFTVTNLQHGNVIKNGKGPNLSIDHHKRGPFENLICNLDVGSGEDIWRCGGGAQLGKHSAARGTFWGIRSRDQVSPPPSDFGPPSMNYVGVDINSDSITDVNGQWIENIAIDKLYPLDLHAAQLKRRLANDSAR